MATVVPVRSAHSSSKSKSRRHREEDDEAVLEAGMAAASNPMVDGPVDGAEFTGDKATLAAKSFLDSFAPPHAGHGGALSRVGLELLEDEEELASLVLNKSLEPIVKSTAKKEQDKRTSGGSEGCCGCLKCPSCCSLDCCSLDCCSCLPCCKRPTAQAQASGGETAGAYTSNRYLVVVTNRRVVIREEDCSAQHTASAFHTAASASEGHGCCWYMWCWWVADGRGPGAGCLCGSTASGGVSASGNATATSAEKLIDERVYLTSDLKDVKFLMLEKRRVENTTTAASASNAVQAGCCAALCCGAPPAVMESSREEVHVESALVELDFRLTFVKKVGDYQGGGWDWFEGIKASHTEEHIHGTVTDPRHGHALRRALMTHQERLKASVPAATAVNVTPGPAAAAGSVGGMLGGLGSMLGGRDRAPAMGQGMAKAAAPGGGEAAAGGSAVPKAAE
ncbi:hypothetical protein HYH03_015491 [Edaphochlamys debaryana]|uniref:Uncharacterized protein n=1 Tax=Edaphochlamys debaryana TaxID=47281 RepID=A0A835XTQ8_9CHLO|nr:hypothetical protein HYH03_015491 [Edaphochlamys debaryana]|eukprot:KAG2485779.1 hypothetical protein HYH03_015491 [Edaphochlamys debaryana]